MFGSDKTKLIPLGRVVTKTFSEMYESFACYMVCYRKIVYSSFWEMVYMQQISLNNVFLNSEYVTAS